MTRLVTLCYMLVLVVAAPAAAGVRIGGVDATSYPEIQATVVGSQVAAAAPVIRENGRPVVGFAARNLGRQKAVVLALDASRSMKGRPLADAVAAAQRFVALKGASDRIAVVSFANRAIAQTAFSTGTADAAGALGGVRVGARSGTALYDAIVLAARKLEAQPLPGRAIVVLTDGRDVSSAATLDDAVLAARRAHASVYPIGVAARGFDASPLRRLARDTGGSYHAAGASRDLGRVYAAIAAELAHTWRISYTTAARPGETLRLRIRLGSLGTASAAYALPPGGASGAERPSRLVPAPFYGSVGTLGVAAAVALLCLLAAGFVFAARGGSRLRARLDAHVVPSVAKRRRSAAGGSIRRQVLHAVERAFGDFRRFKSLQRLLERADLPLRASEFLFIQLGAGFAIGMMFAVAGSSAIVTLLAMAGGAWLPRLFAQLRARSRLKAFENQLPDLLITIAASLKAGHSFRQGIQTVVDEGRPPASDEFKRVLTETSLGRPMDDALKDMAERVGSKNLEFVMTAVTIQRQVGGSLAGLFDMVADAVRQRQQFARKIKGLTAMGRLSAYVLIGLPIFLLGVLTLMNPRYMSPLYHTSTGHMLIALGLAGMTVGSLMLQKIVSFKG